MVQIFTARKRRLRKLCFHRFCLSTGGSASKGYGADTVNERAVRILLVCILVKTNDVTDTISEGYTINASFWPDVHF